MATSKQKKFENEDVQKNSSDGRTLEQSGINELADIPALPGINNIFLRFLRALTLFRLALRRYE